MKKKIPSQNEIKSTTQWGIWEKEPSVFSWYYDEKETCYILEGRAEVRDNKGNILTFGKGDWVEFKKGTECNWTIFETIKKRYLFG